LVPSSIVLSHPEQLARLELDCPEAVPAVVLAGDPCLDRILASRPWRAWYRRSFGVDDTTKLVVVTSTWGRDSLFGRDAELLTRLLAELPMDEYRVAAVLHPNVWHGHSPWQVRTWLSRCERAGLIVLPPREGWRAALVAADLVIGDHGSVTFYGAALGPPVLLAAFPFEDVDDRSPVAQLGHAAPHLVSGRPLLPQIEWAIDKHDPESYSKITAQASSDPGESARLLRTEFYRLLNLPEPNTPAVVCRIPVPDVTPASVTAILATTAVENDSMILRRYPSAAILGIADIPRNAHLVVDEVEAELRMFELADVIVSREPHSNEPPLKWLEEVLIRHPGAYLAAVQSEEQGTLVLIRDERTVYVTGGVNASAELHASIVYGWLAAGKPSAELPAETEALIGNTIHRVCIKIVS
jgi:hypothetical protein